MNAYLVVYVFMIMIIKLIYGFFKLLYTGKLIQRNKITINLFFMIEFILIMFYGFVIIYKHNEIDS